MSTQTAPADPPRVLALVPACRFAGLAVVDVRGIAPGGFASWSLRGRRTHDGRSAALARRLLTAIKKYRPTVIVLGIPRFDGREQRLLREVAADLAASCEVPVLVRSCAQARQLILGRLRGQARRVLADRLTCGFFPELASVKTDDTSERYRSHALEALALAVHDLVGRAPLSAAVIAQDAAFAMGGINAALTDSAKRHFPDNL